MATRDLRYDQSEIKGFTISLSRAPHLLLGHDTTLGGSHPIVLVDKNSKEKAKEAKEAKEPKPLTFMWEGIGIPGPGDDPSEGVPCPELLPKIEGKIIELTLS